MKTLTGLAVETFCHPDDMTAQKMLNKAKWLAKVLEWSANQETQLTLQVKTLGDGFAVTAKEMPELYGLLEEVCQTLDYAPIPKLFLQREATFDIYIYAGDNAAFAISTYALEQLDREILRFKIGRAVTALKARTRQLSLATEAIVKTIGVVPVARQLVVPPLANWYRQSRLTMDRGGLLACQDVDTAYRAMMRETGIPARLCEPKAAPEYVRTYQSGGKLTNAAQYAQTIMRMSLWKNDRLVELYKWIQSGGYDDIMEEYD